MDDPSFVEPARKEKKGKYRREKAWDDDTIDHWKIDPFTPEDNKGGPFAAQSSFATLFPQYREQYLRQIWGQVTKVLDQYHIDCKLDCVEGSMSVYTTRKTYDPYIIIKARDLIKLLSRSVPFEQAIRVLQDDTVCDIIKISSFVSSKERLIRRRQRLIGADGATLKAIELLTGCYMLVQGNTVSVIGSYKGIKQVRKIVEDCMRNIHPIYNIKTLMIKRELMKDPTLANENWDRFLPKFKKRNQPKHKKQAEQAPPPSSSSAPPSEPSAPSPSDEAAALLGAPQPASSSVPPQPKKKKTKKERERDYTPFPPPQPERKEDKLIASGEYFLSPEDKRRMEAQKKKEEHRLCMAEKAEKRAEKFVPPKESNTVRTRDAADSQLLSLRQHDISSLADQIKSTMSQQEDKLSLPSLPEGKHGKKKSSGSHSGDDKSKGRRKS